MSNTFEDYREVANVRDKLELVIDLVNEQPRRVFLTKKGKVVAVVIGPEDYEDLWQIELDRDMKVCDDNPQDCISGAEMRQHMDELEARARARRQ